MQKLSEEIGAHFIVGLSGVTLAEQEAEVLSALRPLGVIIFANNIDKSSPTWPQKLEKLLNSARTATGRSNSFIVSIDHEGGRVHRLTSPVTHFPEAKEWRGLASQIGQAMGSELQALGFNLNFAPVLDIQSEPTNTVIGTRAFSETTKEVIQFSRDFLFAMEKAGVLGCGKHFPGHGATIKDSHFDLPVLKTSRSALAERELQPFIALINDGIKMLMTAHVCYPQLDPNYPATLSKTIITDLLRCELGFGNVVISDALEMGALAGFSEQDIATHSIKAGVDLLLVAQPKGVSAVSKALGLAKALEVHAHRDSELRDALTFSGSRIATLTKQLPTGSNHKPSSQKILGCPEHQELCRLAQATATSIGVSKKS